MNPKFQSVSLYNYSFPDKLHFGSPAKYSGELKNFKEILGKSQ